MECRLGHVWQPLKRPNGSLVFVCERCHTLREWTVARDVHDRRREREATARALVSRTHAV